VRFYLEHPWPPLLNLISNELLLFAFIPSPTAVDAGTHDREPVGTGPFKFRSWGAGDHFVVVKNEKYWQTGKPWLNKVVFRTIPDPQTRYASLESGEIDIISIDRGHLIRKAGDNPDLSVYPSQVNGAEIILMNTTKPPLDDIRVRRALALANDQHLHVKMVYGNSVPLVHHPFGDLYACTDVDYPEYDPEKAKQLISDYGKPVKLEMLHSNTSRGRSIGELQQQLFKKIGVQVKPVGLSPVPHMAKVTQKDYQLATWRIPPSGDYGPKFYAKFHSQSPGNFTGYADPEMDSLLEMQRIETDPVKREALLCRLAMKVNRDVPILYRGGRRYHVVTRRKIRDMMDSPGFTIDLASAWVDEKVKFNPMAYEIERKAVESAATAFDCPDPGDVDTVKAAILGAWKGKDTWGATITMNFKADDTVDLHRTGGAGRTVSYTICSPQVYFQGRADVVMAPVDGKLEGHWKLGQYEGDIHLERVN
jgi:4-phytase/acid phosphatase/peptide/nickel transport system substrate-binding protein